MSNYVSRAQGADAKPGLSLNSPECVKVPEAKGERDKDEVLGVGRKGEFCAYPLRMMSYHHVVNDHLGGPPILVAFDPESGAGAVYDPTANGDTLNFDSAGTRNGQPTLRDRETGSIWSLITGEALSGKLEGRKLVRIPSLILTWKKWAKLHKDSYVLKEDLKESVHYVSRQTPVSYALPESVKKALPAKLDERLKPDALVLGVEWNGSTKAYTLDSLAQGQGANNDDLGKAGIVTFYDPSSHAASAYFAPSTPNGTNLDFTKMYAIDLEGERFYSTDRASDFTNSNSWDIEGNIRQDSRNPSLTKISFTRCRWYAWSSAHPKTEIAKVPKLKTSQTRKLFKSAFVETNGFDLVKAKALRHQGFSAVAFDLGVKKDELQAAIGYAKQAHLAAYGWIQAGRDETAARLHPEWLHTPQHSEWLAGKPGKFAVSPWVCVNNNSVFGYELKRVSEALNSVKGLSGVYLCDIQGAPNGCGCGNPLCRSWDNSPGDKLAVAPYNHPDVYFSERFASAVASAFPKLKVIPTLCEECENGLEVGGVASPDGGATGACHGIPCSHPCSLDYYPGLVNSMAPFENRALLTLYKLYKKDDIRFGSEAGWVAGALGRYRQIAPNQPLTAVLQGWDVSQEQRAAQIEQAVKGGATGILMAFKPINQSWKAVEVSGNATRLTVHPHSEESRK